MAKMMLKKKQGKKAAAEVEAAEVHKGPTPGNPLAEPREDVQRWRAKSKYLYLVELQGVKQGAVIPADSKLEAKERFLRIFGILSTDRTVTAKQVDTDHGYHVDINGVVDYFFDPSKHGGKPQQDDDSDDMD